MKITVETMDRAILRALADAQKIEPSVGHIVLVGTCLRAECRASYLAGLADAEKVRDDSYSCGGETGDDPSTFRRGHDAHGEACAKLAKRLRKEIKG
jgi:hypothetical protein